MQQRPTTSKCSVCEANAEASFTTDTTNVKTAEMLNEQQKRDLATQLNGMIDIPFMGEEAEQAAIEKFLDSILGKLEGAAMSDVGEETLNEARGDPEKASSLKMTIVEKLNSMIDIPFVNEEQEAQALGMIVDKFLADKLG